MNDNTTHYDAIVIGGGLAGLSAASFLARDGARVRLLERAAQLGGRAASEERGGYWFNLGPHALYLGGPGMGVLRELGVDPPGGMPRVDGLALHEGHAHRLPVSTRSLLSTRLLGTRDKLAFARALAALPKVDTAPLAHRTLAAWLTDASSRPRVRAALAALSRVATYGNAPELFSAATVVRQMQLALRGVRYLDHGWGSMVAALADTAWESGATLSVGARVDRVRRADGGWVVDVHNERPLTAAAVIVAAPPAVAAGLVDDAEATPTLRRWADAAIPVRAATLDLALDRLPQPKPTFALGIDRPYYLSVHSAVADLTPPGGALVHVAKYLPADRVDAEADTAERELEGVMDLVQPGWRERVVRRRFLPKLTVVSAIATAESGGLAGRPGPAAPGAPGLFVAGDWVGPDGWLADGSLASARAAAQGARATGQPGSGSATMRSPVRLAHAG